MLASLTQPPAPGRAGLRVGWGQHEESDGDEGDGQEGLRCCPKFFCESVRKKKKASSL